MTLEIPEIVRYMRMGCRMPEGALAERMLRLRDEALAAVRQASFCRRFPVADGAIGDPPAAGIALRGTLARHLEGCHAAYLACGTIGAEFDALQRRVSAVSGTDALAVQAAGAALVEKLMDEVEDAIRGKLEDGEILLPRYSPGYGDFPLSAQRELLGLLDAPRRVGVSLTDSFLMIPSKSVSAVIGVKKASAKEGKE